MCSQPNLSLYLKTLPTYMQLLGLKWDKCTGAALNPHQEAFSSPLLSSLTPPVESSKAKVLGTQIVVRSCLRSQARVPNRLLTPSPRHSDRDLEMDSDMDPLFLPNHAHLSPFSPPSYCRRWGHHSCEDRGGMD